MFESIMKRLGQAKELDVTMSFEIPKSIRKAVDRAKGHEAKTILLDYLTTLNRVQLLCVYDDPWFNAHPHKDWLDEAYWDQEWKRSWPLGKDAYESTIPDIVWETIPINGLDKDNPIDLSKLVKQVNGIQKKLDRVLRIIENTEVTMSAKTALGM